MSNPPPIGGKLTLALPQCYRAGHDILKLTARVVTETGHFVQWTNVPAETINADADEVTFNLEPKVPI